MLADHFLYADRHGKESHGTVRIDWLAALPGLDVRARPACVVDEPGFQRWDGNGAVGYLTLAAVCRSQIERPPPRARVVVASQTFPSGVLGYWARLLADAGLLAVLTATSPARLVPPGGGPPLTGTNPLAVGIPSGEGAPVVCDVSMGRVTHGDVLLGKASGDELVPFGGEQAHKAFALAVGLELLVWSLAGDGYGSVLVVARPDADPVPAFRRLAAGIRLPGDA